MNSDSFAHLTSSGSSELLPQELPCFRIMTARMSVNDICASGICASTEHSPPKLFAQLPINIDSILGSGSFFPTPLLADAYGRGILRLPFSLQRSWLRSRRYFGSLRRNSFSLSSWDCFQKARLTSVQYARVLQHDMLDRTRKKDARSHLHT